MGPKKYQAQILIGGDSEDLLDKAWGLEANSRLSCQVYPKDELTVIRIPKYTLNQVSEEH